MTVNVDDFLREKCIGYHFETKPAFCRNDLMLKKSYLSEIELVLSIFILLICTNIVRNNIIKSENNKYKIHNMKIFSAQSVSENHLSFTPVHELNPSHQNI